MAGSIPPPPSYYSTQNEYAATIRRPESDEQTPLNGAPKPRRSSSSSKVAFALHALIFFLILGTLGLAEIISVSKRESWRLEQRRIEKEFNHRKELWLQEQMAKEQDLERRKESWEREQMEKEWDLERRKAAWRNEEAEREDTRRQWAVEEVNMDRKREGWAAEDKVREEDEQRRIGAGLRWTEVQPSERCLRFGTREYSAQLLNVPDDLRMEEKSQWCYRTEVEIHGRKIETPNRCDVVEYGSEKGVYAQWTVDAGEPTCETWWEDFHDEGCVTAGSKKRRIRARLGNHLPPWDNWKDMCATTPVDMLGRHFDNPDACNEWGGQGIIGFWFIHDESC